MKTFDYSTHFIFTDEILPEYFDLNQIFQNSGITIKMVQYIMEHKDQEFYALFVGTRCLVLPLERFSAFKSTVDYDPFEPAQNNIRIHWIWEAKKRVQIKTLIIATEATCDGWGYEPADCFRSVIEKLASRQSSRKQF